MLLPYLPAAQSEQYPRPPGENFPANKNGGGREGGDGLLKGREKTVWPRGGGAYEVRTCRAVEAIGQRLISIVIPGIPRGAVYAQANPPRAVLAREACLALCRRCRPEREEVFSSGAGEARPLTEPGLVCPERAQVAG